MFSFGRRKPTPEDMRVNYCAPSFSFVRGEYHAVWTKGEVKDLLPLVKDSVVVLHPGFNLLSSPREWAGLLSVAHYLVVASRPDDKNVEAFRKEVEKVVFSPMRHNINGLSIVSSVVEGDTVLGRFSGKKILTLDNTGEIEE